MPNENEIEAKCECHYCGKEIAAPGAEAQETHISRSTGKTFTVDICRECFDNDE